MVSFYTKANDTTSQDTREIAQVLAGIREGAWDAQVLPVRALYPGKEYDLRKKSDIPGFTVSGVFAKREDSQLIEHSQLMAMDIDRAKNPELDIAATRAKLQADSFCYACFLSLSGDGLAVLYKVPGDDHRGSWRALKLYLWQEFGLVVDKACPNESRLRFVSSDPALYLNEGSVTFEETVEEEKPKPTPAKAARPELAGGYAPRGNTSAILLQIGVRMIEQAPEGDKYTQVRNAGHLMGGYIESGYLSEDEAFEALWAAVLGKPNVADYKAAEKAIRSGFKSGASKPLLPTWMHHHVRRQEQEGAPREAIIAGMSVGEGIPAEKIGPAVAAVLDEPNWHLLTFWKLVENPKLKESYKLVLDQDKLLGWLTEEGFRAVPDGRGAQLLRVLDNVVYRVERPAIKHHVRAYVRSLPERFDDTTRDALMEVVVMQRRSIFDQEFLDMLEPLTGEFMRDTATSQYSFFANCWTETTAAGITPRPYAELPGLIWERQKKLYPFRLLYSLEAQQCDFHQFMLYLTAGDPERLDQLQRALAYLIHSYKERSNARCVIFMDEIGTVGKSSGGTGKGLLMQGVGEMVIVSEIDGATFDFKDPFRYEEVHDEAGAVFFDEWRPTRNSFEMLFSILTGGLPINRKYAAKKTIEFEDAPKFAIATNEIVTGDDDSNNRRRIEVALAKRYSATFTPRDEFGTDFFKSHWDEDEYNRFYNLALGWVQRHLQCDRQPLILRNESIAARGLVQDVGVSFHEFAEDLKENMLAAVAEGKSGHVWLHEAFEEYQKQTSDKRTTSIQFGKKMLQFGFTKTKAGREYGDGFRSKPYFTWPAPDNTLGL